MDDDRGGLGHDGIVMVTIMDLERFFGALDALLDGITPEETRWIIRHYLGLPRKGAAMTMAAVARTLELTPGHVKNALRDGRRKIRHAVKQRASIEAAWIADLRGRRTPDRDLAKAMFDWLYDGKPTSNPAAQVVFIMKILSEDPSDRRAAPMLAAGVSSETRTGATQLSPKTPERFVERLLSQAWFPSGDHAPINPPIGKGPVRDIPQIDGKSVPIRSRPPLREALNRRALGVGSYRGKAGLTVSDRDGYGPIPYESEAEHRYISQIDAASTVRWYGVQPLAIPYRALGQDRIYHPDLMLQMTDGRVLVVEVKATTDICAIETLRKAMVGKRHCEVNGWGYLLADESGTGVGELMKYPVPPLDGLESFITAVDSEGLRRHEVLSGFPMVGKLRRQELTALLLRNNFVLEREPFWRVRRVPTEFGWNRLLPEGPLQ